MKRARFIEYESDFPLNKLRCQLVQKLKRQAGECLPEHRPLLRLFPFLNVSQQFIQRKIGLILDETGTFIQSGGQYLTSEKRIMKKFQKRLPHGTCLFHDALF